MRAFARRGDRNIVGKVETLICIVGKSVETIVERGILKAGGVLGLKVLSDIRIEAREWLRLILTLNLAGVSVLRLILLHELVVEIAIVKLGGTHTHGSRGVHLVLVLKFWNETRLAKALIEVAGICGERIVLIFVVKLRRSVEV